MAGFPAQPTLAVGPLKLRPLREDDRTGLAAVAADPLIWEQHPDRERHTPAGFGRYFDDALASGGALVVLHDDELIGATRFHGHDPA